MRIAFSSTTGLYSLTSGILCNVSFGSRGFEAGANVQELIGHILVIRICPEILLGCALGFALRGYPRRSMYCV